MGTQQIPTNKTTGRKRLIRLMLTETERQTIPGDWVSVKTAFRVPLAEKLLKFFPDPSDIDHDGRRASSNEFRTFITRDQTPQLADFFQDWDTAEAREYFTALTGVDCSAGKLRIELCQDTAGFYLERHYDIPEKLITLQVYLGHGPYNWGTSFYDNDTRELVFTNRYRHNSGWLTWANGKILHGVEPGIVNGLRRSIIINYVVGDWQDTDQLY